MGRKKLAMEKMKKTGKFVDREFHQALKDRLENRQDLGEAMADTVRLGEGPHWKQRYYFEKFKVKQDDLVDFLQRIRKAYIEGRTLPNRQLTKPFDSNVITPGTNFLHKMSEAIRYYIHDRTTNDPLWQKLKFRVILSDANIPSEGEHKIMDYIRAQRAQPDYDPN